MVWAGSLPLELAPKKKDRPNLAGRCVRGAGLLRLGQDGLDLGCLHEPVDPLTVLEHDGWRAPDRGLDAELLVALDG